MCGSSRVFPNIIGPNGSSFDSQMSHFAGVVALKIIYPPFYRLLHWVCCCSLFWYNCFWHIRGVKSVTYSITFQIKITDELPRLLEEGIVNQPRSDDSIQFIIVILIISVSLFWCNTV